VVSVGILASAIRTVPFGFEQGQVYPVVVELGKLSTLVVMDGASILHLYNLLLLV